MKPYKGAVPSRQLRQFLPFSLPGRSPHGQEPHRGFVFRGVTHSEGSRKQDSTVIDISLIFQNRRQAIAWGEEFLEQAKASLPSRMGRKAGL